MGLSQVTAGGLRTVVAGLLLSTSLSLAQTSTPIDFGYRDFSFPAGTGGNNRPTGEKPESKTWWHDGSWWASLWSSSGNAYHIFRLNLTNQTWEDTGSAIDDRLDSRADTLSDGQKLYIVSHVFAFNSGQPAPPGERGRLYRYSYNTSSQDYNLDAGFPVEVTEGKSETLVIAKDSSGKLWVTYVENQTVMVNRSLNGDDSTWGSPFALPVASANDLTTDDISSVVTYKNRVGILWSNQSTNQIFFAIHPTSAPDMNWNRVIPYSISADDHINLKSLEVDTSGNVFAVIKTSQSSKLIVLLVCESNLNSCASANDWTDYPVYSSSEFDPTRPIILLDTENREIFVFTRNVDSNNNEAVYYKNSDLDTIQFATGIGVPFVASSVDDDISDPTSTKQNLDAETGLVVLASDHSSREYFHNYLDLSGGSLPTITSFSPPSGPFGTSVMILGSQLSGVNSTTFNGTGATFSILSDNEIQATVPSGASTGSIRVTNAIGSAFSSDDFIVIAAPVVSTLTPPSGSEGAPVAIHGSGFSAATDVSFNSTVASFNILSDIEIQATVPSGATTGPISVTNAAGTGTSSGDFTVTQSVWTSLDIGTSTAGSTGDNGGSVTVSGSGSDIWSSSDSFRYVFQSATGDFDISARITDWDTVHSWSKGGLMIRNSTAQDASHAMIMATGSRGIRLQWRSANGESSLNASGPASFSLPLWVKLSKAGSAVTASYSTDGTNWNQVGNSLALELGTTFLYGMAVCSHNEGQLAQGTFDSIVTGTSALPVVSSFTPSTGVSGDTITVDGVNFTGAQEVRFNGVSTTFSVTSDTRIAATVPAGASTGPIGVTNADGTGVSAGDFTVQQMPSIVSFAPSSGPVGTSVSITGSGFSSVSTVLFNGLSATFNVVSDTQILTSVPAAASSGPITVSNPAGSDQSTGDFTVTAVPGITSFNPTSGVVGTAVTLTGANLSNVTLVRFNGTSAGFTVVSDSQIQTSVPAGASTGSISVTNSDGTGTSASSFTVLQPPTIGSFSPSSGSAGATVTIIGSGFSGVSSVRFNGSPASFNTLSGSQISATAPPGVTTGPISVTNSAGTATSSLDFTVTQSAWTSLDIGTATTGQTTEGGGNVTVSGSGADIWGSSDGFRYVYDTASGDLEFSARITDWNAVESWSKGGLMMRSSTAAGAAHATVMVTGSRGIRMQWRGSSGGSSSNANGPSSFTLPLYLKLSRTGGTVQSFHSTNGLSWTQIGAAQIGLGSGFLYGMAVCSHNDGDLAEATFDSLGVATAATPQISSLSPSSGTVGTSVTLNGSNFTGATSVRFDGQSAGYTVQSDSQIQTTVPSGASSGPVTVTNADGTGASPSDFTVLQPPSISSFSPTQGAVGTSVTITGSGFSGATSVRFDGQAAGFTILSDQQIRATVPSGASSGPIQVTGPLGSATSSGDFTVTTSSWISLDIGTASTGTTTEGGGAVTVSGSGADIWGGSDGFRYVFDSATGDVEITARVSDWQAVQSWSKGGLMLRASTAPDAAHGMVMVTGSRGIRFQWRGSNGGGSSNSSGASSYPLPTWLRLSKSGTQVSAYHSNDGTSWSQIGTAQTIGLGSNFLFGMAVSAHSEGEFAVATFDSIGIQ